MQLRIPQPLGTLIQTYRLAGYEPKRDYDFLHVNRRLRSVYPDLVADVVRQLQAAGATVVREEAILAEFQKVIAAAILTQRLDDSSCHRANQRSSTAKSSREQQHVTYTFHG